MAPGLRLALFFCLTSGLLVSGSLSTRLKRTTGCPPGWQWYDQRCFIVMTHRQPMAEAELTCIRHGGNLASIHSYGEHCFIRHLIFQRCRAFATAWIGFFDAVQEGKWLWTDGSRVDFTRWGHREPNNAGGEHCTEINWKGDPWNDIPCHASKPFVCARKV